MTSPSAKLRIFGLPNHKLQTKKGFTLVEVLVGIALISIVFVGFFGAYQMSTKIVRQTRNRVTAAAIANERIEEIRNLPYSDVGVSGSFPDGILSAVSTETRGNTIFNIKTRIDYVVDPKDGTEMPEDECPNDYKRVKISISWDQFPEGEVILSTDIAPLTLAEECSEAGGILGVSVFDAFGGLVDTPLIEIKNPETGEVIKSVTPLEGNHFFSLATSTYRVDVSKTEYSSERSYSIEEVATPSKSNPLIREKQLTEISLSIDRLGSLSIDTLSPYGSNYFIDYFNDQSKIFETNGVALEGGKVLLGYSEGQYATSGNFSSVENNPTDLYSWDELSWDAITPPATDVKIQVYYASGTDWFLIPDFDLAGNLAGFSSSPVDLSSLPTSTYSNLKIKANLSTTDNSTSSAMNEWILSWATTEATPISNVGFNLRGNKKLGTDVNEDPVYKFSNDYSSDVSGHIDINNMEWDSYLLTIDPEEYMDIKSMSSGNPINLSPAENVDLNIYLDSENSLMVTVKENETLNPVFSAGVILHNAEYDLTQYTNENGQVLFIPLNKGNYSLEIGASGYASTSVSTYVSDDDLEIFNLQRIE